MKVTVKLHSGEEHVREGAFSVVHETGASDSEKQKLLVLDASGNVLAVFTKNDVKQLLTDEPTTDPAEPRKEIAPAPGTRLKTKSILDMAGMLTPPEGTHVPIEDMNPWR
jgi:antitoxin PrlF